VRLHCRLQDGYRVGARIPSAPLALLGICQRRVHAYVMCQVRWINAMLGWMWQRSAPSGAVTTRPDVIDSWLRALTDEADKQAVSDLSTIVMSRGARGIFWGAFMGIALANEPEDTNKLNFSKWRLLSYIY